MFLLDSVINFTAIFSSSFHVLPKTIHCFPFINLSIFFLKPTERLGIIESNLKSPITITFFLSILFNISFEDLLRTNILSNFFID